MKVEKGRNSEMEERKP